MRETMLSQLDWSPESVAVSFIRLGERETAFKLRDSTGNYCGLLVVKAEAVFPNGNVAIY